MRVGLHRVGPEVNAEYERDSTPCGLSGMEQQVPDAHRVNPARRRVVPEGKGNWGDAT